MRSATLRAQRAHAAQLADALRYEPCSPTCANWLRYGIQPRNPRPGLVPGLCRGKAHRHENLGYAGRRVLVSRKWSGKTFADHRADRKAWLVAMLDLPQDEDSGAYRWERVDPADPDYLPATQRLLHVLADRSRWQAALTKARNRGDSKSDEPRDREGGMNAETDKLAAADPFAGLPLLISVPRAATLIGISRASAYRFASAGDLPTRRLGRRVYVVVAGLREFVSAESTAA